MIEGHGRHPYTNGETERTIPSLEDRLAEFAYNNNYHSSIQMAPYEAMYEIKCISPLCWTELARREKLVRFRIG